MKKQKLNKKNFAIAGLRRQSYKWPARSEALRNGKIGRNQYICKMCSATKVYGRKDIQLDHIDPIVPLTGWVSFDSFIDRLFCETKDLQVLCKAHHKEKTDKERKKRKIYRDLEKKNKERYGE
jgi:hypothetical protein